MSNAMGDTGACPMFIEGYRVVTNGEQSSSSSLPVASTVAAGGVPSFALQIQNVQSLVPSISPPADKKSSTQGSLISIKQEPVDTGYEKAAQTNASTIPKRVVTHSLPVASVNSGTPRPQYITVNLPGTGQIQGQLINQSVAGVTTPNIIIAHPNATLSAGGNIRNKHVQVATPTSSAPNQVRNVLRTMLDNKTKDISMKNVIEDLLQRNEHLLANNDAETFKPNKRMARNKDRVADNGQAPKSFPIEEPVVFPITGGTTAKINPKTTSKPTKENIEKPGRIVLRPKSPTKHCQIPKDDMDHISHALVELPITDDEADSIFKVRMHEMVCAVGSKVLLMTPKGESLHMDLTCYWCNFCPFKTERKDVLIQHIIDHRFHCKFCSYQSFSRADVIYHAVNSHSSFRETAKMLKYCSFLPDYLQVGVMQKSGLKRKKDMEGDRESKEKRSKLDDSKTDKNGNNDGMPSEVKTGVNIADYDIFQMEFNEVNKTSTPAGSQTGGPQTVILPVIQSVKSRQQTSIPTLSTQGSKTLPISVASLTRSPKKSTLTSATGVSILKTHFQTTNQETMSTQETQTPIEEVDDAEDNGSAGVLEDETDSADDPSFTVKTSPRRSSSGSRLNKAPANIMSGLSWRCGICTFASLNQTILKAHARTKHSSKTPRFIALLVNSQKEYDEIKTSDEALRRISNINIDDHKNLPSSSHGTVYQKSSVHDSAVHASSDPPKKKITIQVPIARTATAATSRAIINATKNPMIFDCPHCEYSSSSAPKVKDHLFFNHPGVTFYALDMRAVRMKQRRYVLFCQRGSCSFYSKDSEAYLNHAETCISSGKEEGELSKKTRELTRTFARKNAGKVSRSSSIMGKLNKPEFGCLYCSFVSNIMVKMRKHVLTAHSGKDTVMKDIRAHKLRKRQHIFFCKICMYQGKSQIERNIHLQRFHKNDKNRRPVEEQIAPPSPASISVSDEEIEYSDYHIPEEEVQRMMNDYVTDEALSQHFSGRPTREAAAKAQVKCRTQGHNPPIYRCLRCGVMFFGMSLMRKHMRGMHPKSALIAIDVKKRKMHKKPYVYFCPQNGCSFSNPAAEAVITHAGEHGLTADDEELALLTSSVNVKSPLKSTNTCKYTNSFTKGNYQCIICDEITLSLAKMKEHFLGCHEDDKIVYIDSFDKGIDKDTDSNDDRPASPSQMFMCSIRDCMFTTPDQKIFELHSLAHGHSVVYECSICQHYAATQEDMKTHITTNHTGQGANVIEIDLDLDSAGAIIKRVGVNATVLSIKNEPLGQ